MKTPFFTALELFKNSRVTDPESEDTLDVLATYCNAKLEREGFPATQESRRKMSEEIKVGTSEVESGVIACGKYLIYPGKTWDGKPMVWIDKEDGEAMGLDEKSLDEIWKDRF